MLGRGSLADLKHYIFGSTSAIVTNVSLIVGLGAGAAGKVAILGGLMTIALADNISDSLGIHMYKEAEGQGASYSVLSTITNFVARLAISATFIALVLWLPLPVAGVLAIAWGMALLIVISYFIARHNGVKPLWEILKHLAIACCVIAISRYVGLLIARRF